MNRFVLSLLLVLAAGSASAATCSDQATDNKLAGAALKSFMGKREKDAKAQCEATAQEKKLAGAARTSFTKKCLNDAVGSK
jgi:psiF repeat